MKKKSVRWMAKVAILGAFAGVLMVLDFPILFVAPDFYKLDFSEIPVLVGAFAMGPMAGIAIETVKILIKLMIVPTTTAGVGELANFLIGLAFVVPASLIYSRCKTRKHALIGMIVGVISMSVIGALLNGLILLPAFAFMFSIPIQVFVDMGAAINPLIVDKWTLVLFATTPFNIIKGILVSAIVFLIYKRVSPLIKGHDDYEACDI